jgi:hypothetical protein
LGFIEGEFVGFDFGDVRGVVGEGEGLRARARMRSAARMGSRISRF